MSRTHHHNGERHIRIRGVKKNPPDVRRIAKALIELARAEAEQKAEAEHRRSQKPQPNQAESAEGGPPSGEAA